MDYKEEYINLLEEYRQLARDHIKLLAEKNGEGWVERYYNGVTLKTGQQYLVNPNDATALKPGSILEGDVMWLY